MKPIVKDLILFVALSLIIAGTVLGSLYVRRTWQEDSAADTLLKSKQEALNARAKSTAEISAELASAKDVLADAAARLSEMKTNYNTSVYDSLDSGTRQNLEKALATVNALAAQDSAVKTSAIHDKAVAARIGQLQQEISNSLSVWKAGQKVPDIVALQQDIAALQNIISGLTPDDSGLTQAQIDSYEHIVAAAEDAVDSAIDSAGANAGSGGSTSDQNASPGSSGSAGSPVATGSSVTATDIQAQQDAVNAAQSSVDNLQEQLSNVSSDQGNGGGQSGTSDQSGIDSSGNGSSNNGSGGSSGNGGDDSYYSQYVPPSPPDMSGKPRLIEGTNSPSETPR